MKYCAAPHSPSCIPLQSPWAGTARSWGSAGQKTTQAKKNPQTKQNKAGKNQEETGATSRRKLCVCPGRKGTVSRGCHLPQVTPAHTSCPCSPSGRGGCPRAQPDVLQAAEMRQFLGLQQAAAGDLHSSGGELDSLFPSTRDKRGNGGWILCVEGGSAPQPGSTRLLEQASPSI